MHCPVSMAGETFVMRDHADCCATDVQFLEQIHHSFTIPRVEVSSRFVGKKACEWLLRPLRPLL